MTTAITVSERAARRIGEILKGEGDGAMAAGDEDHAHEHIVHAEHARGLLVQLLWILIGLAMFKIAWRFAIRRFSSVGN